MAEDRPNVIVLAGPNGAGKSTAAPDLLAGVLGVTEFVNADMIARGLSGLNPEQAALEAGRTMLRQLRHLAGQRKSFAFETTLASQTFAPWIAGLRREGYAFELIFLWLPSPEMAAERVRDRVRQGGHDIPPDTIRRRYRAGLRNFFRLYQPLTDSWRFYDNSERSGPRLLAAGRGNTVETIQDAETWNRVISGPDK